MVSAATSHSLHASALWAQPRTPQSWRPDPAAPAGSNHSPSGADRDPNTRRNRGCLGRRITAGFVPLVRRSGHADTLRRDGILEHATLKAVCLVLQGPYDSDPRVRRKAEALVAAGYSVDVLALRDPTGAKTYTLDGVNVLTVPLGKKRGSLLRYLFGTRCSSCGCSCEST